MKNNFKIPTNTKNYKEEVQKIQKEYEDTECTNNEEMWTRVIETCEEAGKRTKEKSEKQKKGQRN